ncbi:hypothetical protein BL253_10355 [Pseudofrankia asymbiotica]|uniref:Uncharacterized protein n=2 Tax=Pseudofrankia asymbiotica TaxID=1834516 RepID=A0A1V2IDT9_9ACTN|nr:hypothetical protein BL253_10355 [Pseudofrankia asymbiotica]
MIGRACRSLGEDEFRGQVLYEPRSERRQESLVRILATPEDLDPRGRTQRYQAIARAAGRSRAGSTGLVIEGQYDLFDQLGEAEVEDEVGEGEIDE